MHISTRQNKEWCQASVLNATVERPNKKDMQLSLRKWQVVIKYKTSWSSS